MSVYARVRICVRVGIRVSSLHFVSISQVGNERFQEFEKNGLRKDGQTRPTYAFKKQINCDGKSDIWLEKALSASEQNLDD